VRRKEFDRTLERALGTLEYFRAKGRFFGFLHTYDVHCPYDPPAPYDGHFRDPERVEFDAQGKCGNPELHAMSLGPEQARYLVDRYDGGIRRVDELLGEFLEELERRGILEDTLVVITSDHGEEFLEHGRIGHEQSVQREVLDVPLIMSVPGRQANRVDAPVGLMDLVPTLVELLAVHSDSAFDGRSLTALVDGQVEAARPWQDLGRLASLHWMEPRYSWRVGEDHLVLSISEDSSAIPLATQGNIDFSSTSDLVNYADFERSAEAQAALCRILEADLRTRAGEFREHAKAPRTRKTFTNAERARLKSLGY
jgi:arylsulfatase A-like enzyme